MHRPDSELNSLIRHHRSNHSYSDSPHLAWVRSSFSAVSPLSLPSPFIIPALFHFQLIRVFSKSFPPWTARCWFLMDCLYGLYWHRIFLVDLLKAIIFFILSFSLIFTARRIRNACTASYDTTRNVRPCFFSASSHLPYFFDSTLSYSSAAIDHHCFRLDSKCHRLSFQGSGIGLKLTTDFLMRRSVARCPNNRSGSRFL